jgi:hypothetical protein
MPVSSPNSEYTSNLPLWKSVRDCVKGEPAIKEGGKAYLPKPGGQSEDDFKRYMERVHYANFTGRAAEALHGNLFMRLPEQEGEKPEVFANFLENVDLSGKTINQFISDLCWDIIQTGWGGILVDHSTAPEGISEAEKEQLGLTSYLKYYPAESIINWHYDTINNKTGLVRVVLKEICSTEGDDEFVPKEKINYRVLRLQKINSQYVYTQQVWVRAEDKEKPQEEYLPVSEPFAPLLDGKPLDFIPFFPCPSQTPEDSMLLALSYENIGHYQKTADYEQDIHYTGLHTPYVTGMSAPTDPKTKEPKNIQIGGSSVMFLPGDGDRPVSVGYLETQGSDNILKALTACESRMAILRARAISAEKKGVETAEAARIHRAGENSVLGAFARNLSELLTLAIRLGARWRGVPEDITEEWKITLNLDYEGDSQIDKKRLGLQEIENGLITRKRYLRTFWGMTDEEAEAELEEIDEGKKTPSTEEDKFGINGLIT